MPLPLTVSCSSKIQIGFTFWYRLTWVVPDKGPLNGCVCMCVLCVYVLSTLSVDKAQSDRSQCSVEAGPDQRWVRTGWLQCRDWRPDAVQTPKCRRTLRSLLLQQETHGSLPISWLVDHSYESVLALYKKNKLWYWVHFKFATIRYYMWCYFNICSKADICLNLPRAAWNQQLKSGKKEKSNVKVK